MSTTSPSLSLIVACTASNGIGKAGKLPWRLPKEMSYFLRVTTSAPENKKNAVIMGRTTWESIPVKFRPLKDRINIVLTSRTLPDAPKDVKIASSLSSALNILSSEYSSDLHHAFVIGGSQVYTSALEHPATDRLLVTHISEPDYDCDTFFPSYQEDSKWKRVEFQELKDWVGAEVMKDQNEREEHGEAKWEYQMWQRQ